MKRILSIAVALVMICALAACGGDGNSPGDGGGGGSSPNPGQTGGFDLALITDLGTIDDKSFNQGAWEGLVAYAEEFNISHKYFQPAAQGDDAYLNAIDVAVQSGAKVVTTPGFLFEVPVFNAQDRYTDVKFILLDGTPNNGDYDNFVSKIGDNTVSVHYAEEQSGFLAGYAVVMDGFRKLGFMGGMAVPPVIRFGHGYIQGAEVAAQELGLPDGSVTINYFYTGTFEASPDIQTRAAAWYNDGVEVIFSCGGGICASIFTAANQVGAKVIGVDGDQSEDSPTVITSAMKMLPKSVYDTIGQFYAGTFPGGQEVIFAADNLGVGLPMETSRFTSFNQAQYDAIYAKLASKSIVVDNNTEISPNDIPTSAVVVSYLS